MLRLALPVILLVVVAMSSARHEKKGRREETIWERCYGSNSPYSKCVSRAIGDNKLLGKLRGASCPLEFKEVLKEPGSLKILCREATIVVECVITGLPSVTDECRQHYESRNQGAEDAQEFLTLLQRLCTDEKIEKAERSLDCVGPLSLKKRQLYDCTLANPGRLLDCSEFDHSDDYNARSECYSEKYRRSCNASQVITCFQDIASEVCSDEAVEMIKELGNAAFEKFPLCPGDRPRTLKALLNYFKK